MRSMVRQPRTPAQEHALAKRSALASVERFGKATLAQVVNDQGLCEIRAKKALEDLVADGRLRKVGFTFVLP